MGSHPDTIHAQFDVFRIRKSAWQRPWQRPWKALGSLPEAWRRPAGGLPEACHKPAGGLPEACRRPARGLPEACRRPAGGLPEACRKPLPEACRKPTALGARLLGFLCSQSLQDPSGSPTSSLGVVGENSPAWTIC